MAVDAYAERLADMPKYYGRPDGLHFFNDARNLNIIAPPTKVVGRTGPSGTMNAMEIHELIKNPWQIHNEDLQHQHPAEFLANQDASVLSAAEVTYLKEQIMEVLRWNAVSPMALDTLNVGPGLLKVEYWSNSEIKGPRLTRDFEGGNNVGQAKSETTVNLYGMDMDIHLDRVTLDAGNRVGGGKKITLYPGVQQNHTTEIMRKLTIAREYWIFNGSDHPYFTDLGIKGMCNFSGVQDPGALGAGADDDLTAAGDIPLSAMKMAKQLLISKFAPPYELHLSPYVFAQALLNQNATTWQTDMERLESISVPKGGRVFSNIVVNPFMINSETETNATGAMMLFKRIPQNYIAESYSMGIYPTTTMGLGWSAKAIWMGGTVLQRPTAVSFANALTTT